jgi:DNA polymerase-3 subunit epsilon
MSRQIVLDTETTGLDYASGDRIIEVGCIELLDRRLTTRHFHHYVNPERDSDPEALKVHGLTTAFLSDKPKFADIAEAFCDFIRGAELIIHNAPFDLGFLNAELARLGLPPVESIATSVIDTLVMVREIIPFGHRSLDALCRHYEVSNTHRHLHGALVDAALLADVYITMTRKQETLWGDAGGEEEVDPSQLPPLSNVHVRLATEAEAEEHQRYLESMTRDGKIAVMWQKMASTS